MSKRPKFEIRKQSLLPGFETGRYEAPPLLDRSEFAASVEDGERRDNRVSVRIAGKDLSRLKKVALRDGIPVQTLLASIIHQYAIGELREAPPEEGPLPGRSAAAGELSDGRESDER